MSAESVIALFRLCVQKTYFVFNKKLNIQIDGLAIGASTSGFAADLFMERLEKRALTTFIEPPRIWKRYVDDTFSKLKRPYVDNFLNHLNDQHPRINFTTEIQQDNKIAFLDTLVHIQEDKSIKTTIYRKATHTDQYLDFNSNHHVKQKIGIISTFKHRIEELVTTEEDKIAEEAHVKKALKRCGHPNWALNRKKRKKDDKQREEKRGKVVIPYVKGVSENMARIFKKHNIETIHKPTTTLRNVICNKMKDKVEKLDKTGAVYYNKCKKHAENDYVGETDRVLRERMYEHRIIDHKTSTRAASIQHTEEDVEEEQEQRGLRRSKRKVTKKDYRRIHEGTNQILTEGNTEFSAHVASDTHEKDDFEFSILCTEENWFKRGIKESIAIRKIRPTLNLDDGRYHLSPIYDSLIQSRQIMKIPKMGQKTPQKETTEEDSRHAVEINLVI